MTSLKEMFQEKMQTRQKLKTIREDPMPKMSRTELRDLAFKHRIKGAKSLNMKDLCEKLNLPLMKNEAFEKFNKEAIKTPVKITLTSVETMKFSSIYEASQCLKKNPSSISWAINNNTTVLFKGKKWIVTR